MTRPFRWFWVLIIFALSSGVALYAQKTEVSGRVYDAIENEAIPLVGVMLTNTSGTPTGINTNLDGEFILMVPPGKYELRIRFSGYEPYSDSIVVASTPIQNLLIPLEPRTTTVDDVVITSKAVNPAHRVIRNAIKHRKQNRFDKIDSYQYESYNKLVIYLDDVTDAFFDNGLMRNVGKEVMDILGDSTHSDTSHYKIAAFVSESVSKFYYARPEKKKEEILAVKTSGVKGSEYNLLSSMFLQLDMYDNNVVIVDRTFLSPIADGAFLDYKFSLASIEAYGMDTLYGIDVIPKRQRDLVFKGRIYIDNQDWALNRVDLELNENPNINFVDDIHLRQEYTKVDSYWVPTVLDVEVEFDNSFSKGKTAGKVGVIGRTSTHMYDYKINQPIESKVFREEMLEIKEDADDHDENYWLEMRKTPLERSEQLGYALVDSLQSRGILDLYIEVGRFLTVGTKKFNKFEVGPYFGIIGFNQAEGIRTRVGIHTRDNFSKRWYLGGHAAYGFRDDRFKYLTEVRYRINRKPKLEVGLKRTQEVEQVGFENYLENGTGILKAVLRRVPITQLNYFTENKFSIHADMRRGFSGDFYFKTKSFDPAATFTFAYRNDEGGLTDNYNITEAGGQLRISFKEKYITSKRGDRLYLGTKYPIFNIKYAHGLANTLNSSVEYHRASLQINNIFRLGRYGFLRYNLEAGQVFGEVPYPSLKVFEGNQTWGYSKDGFNMMNYFEFVADRYATAVFEQHFEGFFWKKLPLLRRLNWKEVVHARAALGTLSPGNRLRNNVDIPTENGAYSQRILAPATEPYLEAGVGLYNILKFLRVDAIWRLNYHDLSYRTQPNVRKSNWGKFNNFGLRFDLNLTF